MDAKRPKDRGPAVTRVTRLVIFCLLVFASVAGCGGGGAASGGPDPATSIPANAGIYVEGVVRPEGDARENALAAAGKLLGTSTPEKTLEDFFNKNAKDDKDKPLNWDRDVSPWLGDRAGVWASAAGDKGGFSFAIATKDEDKAKEFLQRDTANDRKASYKGVDYTVDSEGTASGIAGDFLLLGTEREFKQTIDAQKGDSLGESDRYKDAVSKLDKDRLGTLFIDVKPLIDVALRQDPAQRQQFEQFARIFPIDKLGPITAAFNANGQRLKIDSHITGQGAETLARFGLLSGAGSTDLLGELPGESWAAYGIPNLGQTAASLFDRFAGALGGTAVAAQVQQATGLDLHRDVFDLIGDVAIFARGSTLADLDGAMIITVTDDARATEVFGKLIALARSQGGVTPRPVQVAGADQAFSVANPRTPTPFVLARGKGKFVVAYGEKAAAAAFQPQSKLRDSAIYKQAKATLDNKYEPAFLFSMDGILKVVDGTGGGTDPDFQQARPYLERLSVITSGGKADKSSYDASLGVGLK
jgi:Protein of unknown function (DUF3352)